MKNFYRTGFYRINYDKRNWQMLIKILNDPIRFQEIHPINRAQIIDDAMNLALSGRLDYRTALDITSYLVHERSYVPWKAGLVALGYIDTMLSKGAYYLEYKVGTYLELNKKIKTIVILIFSYCCSMTNISIKIISILSIVLII